MAFRRADTDGSGDIDESELMDVLRGLNISSDRSQVRTVMRRYDEGKGSLRLAQFRLLVADLRKFKGGGSSVDDVEDAFRKADTDGSGDIDESELMDVLRGLNIS